MPTTLALLRGINVGGKVLKMDRIKASFVALGLSDVRTYIQSGNVLFSAKTAASTLAQRIEAQLLKDSGLEVSVLLKTPAELAKAVRQNPFLLERGIDLKSLHLTFLSAPPGKAALAKLAEIDAGDDRCRPVGAHIYVHCPSGYGRTKLHNTALERCLGVTATTRNWNTVNKLLEMAAE